MFASSATLFDIWRNPISLSLRIYWLFYPVHVAGILVRNSGLDKSLLEFLLQATLSPLVGAIVLLLARRFINTGLLQTSARVTLSIYALMGISTGVTIRIFADGLDVSASSIITGMAINFQLIITMFTIFSNIAITLGAISQSLSTGTQFLAILRRREEEARKKIIQETEQLQQVIDQQIGPLLNRVKSSIDNFNLEVRGISDGDLLQLAMRIREESIPEIRDASHKLAQDNNSEQTETSFQVSGAAKTLRFLEFFKRVTLNLRPPSFLISGILFLFIIFTVRGDCRPKNIVMALIMATVLLGASTMAQYQFFKKAPRSALLVLASSVLIYFSWMQVYRTPVYACTDNQSTAEILYATFILVSAFIASGIYSQLLEDRMKEEGLVRIQVAVLQAKIQGHERRLNSMKGKAGNVLHGPILGRLSSIVLALTDFAEKKKVSTPNDILELQKKLVPLIESASDELALIHDQDSAPTEALDLQIKRVVSHWNGLINVETKISDMCLNYSKSIRPQLDLAELVQELITNANRHASARNLNIIIDLLQPTENSIDLSVKISCTDDGVPADTDKQETHGIGLKAITQIGGKWRVTPLVPKGNLVEIEFPYFAQHEL